MITPSPLPPMIIPHPPPVEFNVAQTVTVAPLLYAKRTLPCHQRWAARLEQKIQQAKLNRLGFFMKLHLPSNRRFFKSGNYKKLPNLNVVIFRLSFSFSLNLHCERRWGWKLCWWKVCCSNIWMSNDVSIWIPPPVPRRYSMWIYLSFFHLNVFVLVHMNVFVSPLWIYLCFCWRHSS